MKKIFALVAMLLSFTVSAQIPREWLGNTKAPLAFQFDTEVGQVDVFDIVGKCPRGYHVALIGINRAMGCYEYSLPDSNRISMWSVDGKKGVVIRYYHVINVKGYVSPAKPEVEAAYTKNPGMIR